MPVSTNICIAIGAVPSVGVTVSQGWSAVAVKLSVPAPVLFTLTEASAGLNGLPCTAEKETAFDERLKDGEATWTCPPPPHPAHNDASTNRIPVRQRIDKRLEGSSRQNGPKVRFICFSPHRLMRNGVAGCVHYYDRESRGYESISMVRKRQLDSAGESAPVFQTAATRMRCENICSPRAHLLSL